MRSRCASSAADGLGRQTPSSSSSTSSSSSSLSSACEKREGLVGRAGDVVGVATGELDSDRSNEAADGSRASDALLELRVPSSTGPSLGAACRSDAAVSSARWSTRASAMSASRTPASPGFVLVVSSSLRISSSASSSSPSSSSSFSSSSDGNGGTKDSAIDALATSRASPETRASVSDGVRDARRLARLARRLAVSPSSWPVASAAAAAAALALSLAACAAFTSAGLALNPPDGVWGLIGDSVAGWIAVSDRDSRVADDDDAGEFLLDDERSRTGLVGDRSDGDGWSPGPGSASPSSRPPPIGISPPS
mmetsp:Transcript_10371/g.42962  ORF Transcript_10371/g.42962 Transcript_10371/m.42962 type:complete len:309 (+) Transcript_10371:1235-2161(+)